jgi:hypothetical protein
MSNDDNIIPINGEPEEPDPIIILDDVYVKAFLGNSVSPIEPPRAVYSLPLLVIVEKKRLACDEAAAQRSIVAMMRQIYKEKGNQAPHFVDDSIKRPDKNRILTRGGRR